MFLFAKFGFFCLIVELTTIISLLQHVLSKKNMDLTVGTLLVVLSQLSVTLSTHVSGIISENMTFFYQKLPVAPSVRATIEFNISYSECSMGQMYPSMGIYTEYPNLNIEKRCSYQQYGQLCNEDLHPHLKVGTYRTTTCELSGSCTVNCRGRVVVQDYMPRSFSLYFGFSCDWPPIYLLRGLRYNISFTKQTNETSGCTDYSVIYYTEACSRFYKETSLPNLIGDVRINHYAQYFKEFRILEMVIFENGTCYQHIWEVICYIFLPKCDPFTKQVLHPCREMCWDFVDGCWRKFRNLVDRIDMKFVFNKQAYLNHIFREEKLQAIDCDYLPSLNDSITCFYKPVTCNSPPDVTNGTRILNTTQKDVYQLHDVVQYACINDTFEMIGYDSITCLYSGQWSQSPPKCSQQPINPLLFVLPVLIVPLMTYTGLVLCIWCHKTKRQSFKRNRQYDAFVCYCYEGQDPDFAEQIIPQKLEEKHGLNLCIHRRDFKAGWDIKWNIMNAIRNSNSAIIIMSQDYINSLWCVEEFEDCYMENMKDPAFKLFVILMQSADSLNITSEYIQSFFAKKTYLERDDPKLYVKIAKYLTWVKQPKGKKPPLDGTTEDTTDPLLGKNDIKNEDKIFDKIMVEEYKENIKLRNVHSDIEMDVSSEDSDEELVISYRQSDDESGYDFLDVRGMKSNFKNPTDDGYMET